MARYSLHMDLTKQCMQRFNGNKLDDIAELEQAMATGPPKPLDPTPQPQDLKPSTLPPKPQGPHPKH
jgi:hypothetical protein